jgi:hypothetical protein
MKTIYTIFFATIIIISACHKDDTTKPGTQPGLDNYTSMAKFFTKNGVTTQTYTVTGSVGGSFTTPQGTVVTIPANAFVNNLWQVVTGPITITFKDLYKKSDMLLSNIPTNTITGAPLKSGGEFFIKATSGGAALNIISPLTIKQPLNGFPLDSNMKVFIKPGNDSVGWVGSDSAGYTEPTLANYVFSLYQFNSPVDSGSWCNSDNSTYFSAYTQTTLTLKESDNPFNYDTYVFLVFKGINSMVHVYMKDSVNTFPYNYAPLGLQCTVVAVGIKGGTVYSSFTPITIGSNQTVTFSMTQTTTAAFKSQLSALD